MSQEQVKITEPLADEEHNSAGESTEMTERQQRAQRKAKTFKKKGGMLLNNAFAFVAAALLGFSKMAGSYEMIIAGRFFIGLNSGINAGIAPMYLTEVSPTHLRGAVGTAYQLVVTISILASQILGIQSVLGTADTWPLLLALTVVPAIFQLITLPLCPESPKYILIAQGKEVEAQKALTWLRESVEVLDEMEEIRNEYESMKLVPTVTLREMATNPSLKFPLIISMMMMIAQQLSGINCAIFFSTQIFLSAGLTLSQSESATIGMGAMNVCMTILSLVLVERAGRKTLLLIGLIGMFICTILLTICLILKSKMGPYVFLIFSGLLFFFSAFTYKFVPETKNKGIEEITAMFRQRTYNQ
ncbi:unnamed protein product [Notodromas monacha]|uniref:Major facilitator superfamily (MFS) profile domain-containing protein n=1 Tax=Notodromas monacha TaxID=399045 RepID=A0A7R9BGY2_9CRUS|nr:unnamed protein product [Notodromas monacha]CAG0913906.1 unnamed protein product [Notodromas monacha]